MPYTVSCSPAPLTFTIRPRFDWQYLLSIAWLCFLGYRLRFFDWRNLRADAFYDLVFLAVFSLAAIMSLIRRERIEFYSDEVVWRWTYFGITRSKCALLSEVLGAEWCEGEDGNRNKSPDYVEFYLADGSIKACFGFTFEEFDRMREEIRTMFPDLVKRWGNSTVRSKDFTLLNLS